MKRLLTTKVLSFPYTVYKTLNPATGEVLEEFTNNTQEQIDEKVSLLWDSYQGFKTESWDYKKRYLEGVAENLQIFSKESAEIMTVEVGKIIGQSYAEVDKCLNLINFFIENGESMISDIVEPYGVENSTIVHEPLGIIFQLAPFNFPFWQVIRFCVPAMVAGNTVMVRHSRSCPGNGRVLEKIFNVEGFPTLYKNIYCDRELVDNVIADKRVRGVAFTGSTNVGRIVAQKSAENLKKHVLELGGSDAFIVCEDADIDKAVDTAILSRITLNCGQSCNAAKRIIVNSKVKNEFIENALDKIQELIVGDTFNSDVQVGPMARLDLRDELHQQVLRGVKEGAQVLCGGGYPAADGFFYSPTLIIDVSPDTPSLFFEETFGPVMCVVEAIDDNEAIELANSSNYGLSGVVFTEDIEKGENMARQLEVGLAYVNRGAASHWALPFGGFPGKETGYGRECGIEGVKEWCNIKTLLK